MLHSELEKKVFLISNPLNPLNVSEEIAIMSQTNGQHDDFSVNGPGSSFQASFQQSADTEFPAPTGPPISDFLTQLSDYNTTIPGEEV